jgi:hypothetical protein
MYRKCCGKAEDDVARGEPSADVRGVAIPTDIIAPGVLGVERLLFSQLRLVSHHVSA